MELEEKKKRNDFLLEKAIAIIELAKEKNIQLRLLGGLGVYNKCFQVNDLFTLHREPFSDIDLVCYGKDIVSLENLFLTINYEQDKVFKTQFGYQRRVFYSPENISVEVFLNDLYLCQTVKTGNRLILDFPTITSTDLFLSKIQKINLSHKDVIDLIILLSNIPLTDNEDSINISYITTLCASDWRWWKTISDNLSFIKNYKTIFDKNRIDLAIGILEDRIHKSKKNIFWSLRNIIGTKINWYNQVDD